MTLVAYEMIDHVAVATMDSGDNQFNPPFLDAFLQTLDAIENEPDARTLVVTSAHEKIFSNGIDLAWLGPVLEKGDLPAVQDFFFRLNRLLRRLVVYPMTTIAAMRYAIDLNKTNLQLSDFTAKAIELLKGEDGFFMMVEGGKIDWACHANDAATSIHETIAFSNAIDVAIDFYKAHPDETLIIVTADHETGGMALGNVTTKYETDLSILQHQIISSQAFVEVIRDFRVNLTGDLELDFKHMLEIMDGYFGLGNQDKIPLTEEEIATIKKYFITSLYTSEGAEPDHAYHDEEPLAALLNKMMSDKAGIGWTTYSHTGVNVPVYALGIGSDYFSGSIDNTDIPNLMEEIIVRGAH